MKRTAIVAALALLIAGCKAPPAKEIKIGLITPLTGDVKTFGESVKNAFEIAVDEANKAGGVAGMKVVPVVVDDKNDPTEASNAANLLINQQKVRAIIGSVTSKATIPVSDMAQSGKIPAISPSATNPKVTVEIGRAHV
jgi:branched-chain amino acid transport system substrate-binding protein